MSNQLVELGGGRTDDRPWGRTFARFSQHKLSGQVQVAEGDRTFVVAFAEGTVIGARSPLATDAAVRVARLANLISPMQVSSFVHKHGTTPGGDDVDLLVAHAKLSAEQATDLRRKVIAHRAARTFSVEAGGVTIEPVASIAVVPGCVLDPRAIIYQGARNNLSERRLIAELARMGSWLRIKPGIDLDAYGFGTVERSLLDRLRTGGTIAELESCSPGLDVRMVRGVLYALCSTDACDLRPTAPVVVAAVTAPKGELAIPQTPSSELDSRPTEAMAPLTFPPEPESLDALVAAPARSEDIEDLPAPRFADNLLAPKPRVEHDDLLAPVYRDAVRDRNATVVDAPPRIDLLGVTVDGRYVLDRKLGEGAMGAVYLSHHTRLDRLFAVKVLHRRLLDSAKSRKRFEREAELTSRLSHHNVVRVVDVGVIEDLPYLAMEFAEGTSLGTVLVDAPLPQPRAFNLLRQLCAGLAHAHDAGLIHRDLKPSNILVDSSTPEEMLRIVDFGIAILNEPEGTERLTTRGVMLGTPDYMAPELGLGSAIDHRLDLYALGVIAYEMFTGVRPFVGDGVDIALANADVNRPVPPMGERAPGVDVDPLVEALVRKLLAKTPAARPAGAAEVRRLVDLIDHDRAAAAAALGVVETRAPAETRAPVGSGLTTRTPTDERAAIKTRAMWQLEREDQPALRPPAAPAPAVVEAPSLASAPVVAVEAPPLASAPAVAVEASPVAIARPRTPFPPRVGGGTAVHRTQFDTEQIAPLWRSRVALAGIALAVIALLLVVVLRAS